MDRVLASEAEDRSSSLRGGTNTRSLAGFLLIGHITFNEKFGTNRLVYRINISFFIALMVVNSGCIVNPASQSATPDFVTSTLPGPPNPKTTPTLNPSAGTLSGGANSTPAPIEGSVTTQVNVRAGPSTADDSIGIINSFTKVQVTGKDATGSWYRIVYTGSAKEFGWVRAEYVQVNAPAEIPVVGSMAGNGSGGSGLVIQKINVRKGPAQTFESLGVLNPKDVVFITGKDPSGKWIQIEFANAPTGTGWVALEFLEVGNTDSLLTIGGSEPAEQAPTNAGSILTTIFPLAFEDGDSMQAPLSSTILSSTNARALQIEGDVSAPDGDRQDWVQFSSSGKAVLLGIQCSSKALQVELWNNQILVESFLLTCGNNQTLSITPKSIYLLAVSEPGTVDPQYTNYTLSLELPR